MKKELRELKVIIRMEDRIKALAKRFGVDPIRRLVAERIGIRFIGLRIRDRERALEILNGMEV